MSSKSTNRTNATNYSRSSSKRDARVAAQTPIDAKLQAGFEESEKGLFDYSTSVDYMSTSTSNVPSSTVSAYLQKMQRGSLVQPFGCMIAIDEKSFGVLGFSENAPEMLDLSPYAVPNIEQRDVLTFGTDVRTLFKSSCASALQKAANFGEVSLLNPILVHCRYSGKPFYAVLHRIDVGLVIDLEPVDPDDVPVTAAGALKSYKLAAKAISKLQALPGGNITTLCDVLVQEMIDLTGYDRVMVYKFHEDEHGEVIAESRKPELDPYLGLHYPSTDIPQASRFLFMMNKVRMICDCYASPVKVVQSNRLDQPLCLSGSILRAPHGCHSQYMANMGSIASLVLAVTINEEDDEAEVSQKSGRRLWGLVVCHHSSPKFVPFPLRYACEFLVQVFSVQISKEVELASQLKEKNILRTQTVLCDMLLRGAPVGIITQSPNVMDLVKCDGAALYYNSKFWLLGTTPTEAQIRNITEWLLEYHGGSTGLSTDSLMEAGYPGATILGDAICGMAAVRISSKNFLFWFRSHAAKEIKWGGAKHDPIDKDDARKMHPRSSFKAFLEVVKRRSLPWEDVEMDAIHSLQLILRNSLRDEVENSSRVVVKVPSGETSLEKINELRVVTNEMVRLIETASVPILAVDVSGDVNGWNTKIAELTGLSSQEAVGTPFVNLVVDESIGIVQNMLSSASQGIEEKNVEVKLKSFGQENNGPIILVANVCCNRDVNENIVGVCLIGNDITGQKLIMDKFTRIQGDYVGIVQSPTTLIPPIFMMNEQGQCFEWNDAMQKLSGLKREEVMDRMLLGEVFTVNGFGCRLKDQDTLTKLKILLNRVITGEDANKVLFGFFDRKDNFIEALLSASKRIDEEGSVTGVLCFLHVPSPELQYTLKVQKISEQAAADSLAKLSYIRHEIGKPLSGIKCMQDLMQSSDLSKEQWQLLRTSTLCREQLAKIIDDTDIATIEECYMELNSIEFNLGEALEVIKSQVVTVGQERRVQIVYDIPIEVLPMNLYGDNLRLQQVISDFLTNALLFTPGIEGSSVLFKLIAVRERIGTKMHVVHLEFRITHPAPGVPEELIREMFRHSKSVSREGLGLYISQKLVKIMNGTVQYLREAERSSFIILIEFPVAQQVKYQKTKQTEDDERQQSSWPTSR